MPHMLVGVICKNEFSIHLKVLQEIAPHHFILTDGLRQSAAFSAA